MTAIKQSSPKHSSPRKSSAKSTPRKRAHIESAPKERASAAASVAPAPHRYFNRDESWLRFNERVLEEAADPTNPLLERVKFLAITASNLDEFLEIRIAGELQRMEEEEGLPQRPDEGGLTLAQRLQSIRDRLHRFAEAQDACWNDQLLPALKTAKIHLRRWKSLSKQERLFAERFYNEQVDPLLTPVTIDPSHPFPRVLNKALCLALLLRHKRKPAGSARAATSLGVITVPRSLPRLIALPTRGGDCGFMFLDELIEAHAERMFRGYRVLSRGAFRVTRNSNLYMQEEESRSVLESVRSELHNRRKGDAVRLQIDTSAADEIVERLRVNFELEPWQVFRTSAPVNLSRLMNLYTEVKQPELKFPEFSGREYRPLGGAKDIFEDLRNRDILLHHPFDSYGAIEGFIEAGANDPEVVSMKQTLYRTSADSSMFRALTEAAQSKDVTVVIELMARFDEDSNIRWARELEEAGVQVFHGIFGLKTHCKLALLVRRDPDGVLRRYAHLGTGNYNPETARFYTDLSLLTSRPKITEAVQRVFRYLTADWETEADAYRPLLVAPITLAEDTLRLIDREAEHARAGKPARIVAKMNALLDQKTVEALYAASNAGVEIDLIVRGMCSLRPGVAGMSERIRVRSIVGRFLEHTRIFWFANAGNDEVYAGSADWMTRNLVERCEVVFPIDDLELSRRAREEILGAYLRDDRKARLLQSDGDYLRPVARGNSLSAQEWLMEQARKPRAMPEGV
ncbi:MAG: polyphosphate kinase 1 [Acidobacteriaceae bacterium]